MPGKTGPATWKVVAAVCGAVVLLLVIGSIFSGGDDDEKTDSASPSTPRPTTTTRAPNGWGPATPTLDPGTMRDAAFIASIMDKGVPINDREGLLNIAVGACAYLDMPDTNVPMVLAQLLRDEPQYTPEQIGSIVGSAVDVYCPDERT